MNFVYIALVAFIFANLVLLVRLLCKKDITLSKLVMYINAAFCIEFIICSLPFLLARYYNLLLVLGVLELVNIGFTVLLRKRKHKMCSVKINRDCIPLFVLLAISIIFVFTTTEEINDISDQGTYFKHYSALFTGQEDFFDSIHELGTVSLRADVGLKDMQKGLSCFKEYGDGYSLHAVNTWCIFLVLFGKMFGFFNGYIAINYLFIVSAMIFYEICVLLAKNSFSKWTGFVLYLFSPLVLYIAKAGFTESLFGFVLLISLYMFIQKNDFKYHIVLAGVCLGLAGFIHISYLIFFPVLSLALFLMSFKYHKYGYANAISVAMYASSLWYVYICAPAYTIIQFEPYAFGPLTVETLFAVLTGLAFVFVVFQLFISKSKKKLIKHDFQKYIIKYGNFLLCILMVFVFLYAMYKARILATSRLYSFDGDGGSWNMRNGYMGTFDAWLHLNFTNISRSVGHIAFFSVLAFPFFRKKMSEFGYLLYFIIVYSLLYHCIVMLDTPFNYYASRYFYPVITPLVLITFVEIDLKKPFYITTLVVSLAYYALFLPAFVKGAPFVGKYQMLEETMDVIPENAVVLCDVETGGHVTGNLVSNLRLLNSNKVYNLRNLSDVKKAYPNEPIYVISSNDSLETGEQISGVQYKVQFSFGNGEHGTYSMKYGEQNLYVFIYEVK